jgi:hypothetical protein
MNYRRGFQRAYAALTVVWIAAMSFAIFYGDWKPWFALRSSGPWQIESEAVIRHGTASDIDWAATSRMEMQTRWMWAAGLSILPPLAAYVILFYALPWVYRGFRPAPRI